MNTDIKIIGIISFATIIILIGSVFLFSKDEKDVPQTTKSIDVISNTGIHWHPEISIYINGQKQQIPKDVGMSPIEKPIHTHAEDNIIHMEFSGKVTKEEIKIKNFFQIWGKQFNSKCILDKCIDSKHTLKMFVNGKENKEFENYQMRDRDKIEIRYE